MNLDDAQMKQVSAWIHAGLKLSEIQNRLAAELGVRLTYMEVRLLVDDLKLVPKDAEPPASTPTIGKPPTAPATGANPAAASLGASPAAPTGTAPDVGSVTMSVDALARPGALVSGQVTFSDGQRAAWYLDEMGRLGLAPRQNGYRPAAADVQQFQMALETELAKLGL